MTSEAAEKLEDLFKAFRAGVTPVLLLDYDGTLAPFRLDRFKARPWAGVRELLARIQQQGKTRMAVITGRPAREIAPLLRLRPIDQDLSMGAPEVEPALEVWGLHGAERLYPDGRRELEQASDAALEKLEAVRELLRRDSLGGLFEDKANAAVMHWRGASRRKAEQIERRTRELFEPLARMEGLALLEFESGIELRVGRDKGGAVEAIIAEAGAGGPVAFLGDDLTDEVAFQAVKGRGLGVLVRREWRETAADVWLRPPGELKGFLARWVEAGNRE